MLRLEAFVRLPAATTWVAVSDFYGFSHRFPVGEPKTSQLALGGVTQKPRRRIEYSKGAGLGYWVVQELQVCDESQQVLVTTSLDSRIPGGTTRMELVRVSPDGEGSRLALDIDYRPIWYLAPFAWFLRRRIKKLIMKSLARINTTGASSLKPALPNQWSMAAYQRDLASQPAWVQRVLSEFD